MPNGKSKLAVVVLSCVLILLLGSAGAQDLDAVLSFEKTPENNLPAGWGGGPPVTLGVDETVRHEGDRAGRIIRTDTSPKKFSSLTMMLPADVEGSRITLKAWVRSENVDDNFGLWLRQDGRASPVAFTHNYDLGLKGNQEWQQVSVTAELSEQVRQILFGLMLKGAGTVWIDDVHLFVDDKPYADVPKTPSETLKFESDVEFDAGSGIADLELTAAQVEDIATLIEIWGFVKYHHPAVAVGEVHIDFELFRVVPQILAANRAADRNRLLLAWVQGLGTIDPCTACVSAPEDVHLEAPIAWIRDVDRLGNDLSTELRSIYENRTRNMEHVFITRMPGVGNANFKGEMPYTDLESVDAGFRLLALARLWNIVQYWFPYRDLIDTPWHNVLRTAIPRLVSPLDSDAYAREMIRVIVEIRDTHANLWGSLDVRPPAGSCILDAGFRFVQDEAIVWALSTPNTTDLKIGDVLIELDGRAVNELVEEWSPYYAASNAPTRLRDIGRSLSVGPCEDASLRIRRGTDGVDTLLELTTSRIDGGPRDLPGQNTHDRAGNTFQDLSDDVAYIKLSSIELDEVATLIQQAQSRSGLVVDIRNYPSAFVVRELGQRLVTSRQEFARFTQPDLANPGAFHWTESLTLEPATPVFDGKVAILVDEISQSQAEYTAMALRVNRNALVVGSATAGADGNVSSIPLPGGLRSMISGIGVFYPDKSPTQRIGILADIQAGPTISGIRAGRDEVLEAALRYILGEDTPQNEIESLALRP